MSTDSLHETLLKLALPAVRAQGLEIWGLELLEGRQMTVRLFVEGAPGAVPADNPAPVPADAEAPETPADEPVEALPDDEPPMEEGEEELLESAGVPAGVSATVDQCETISRQLSLALDVEDLIDRAYTLEVSTPGFNRIFFTPGQMAPYVGDMVEARMPSPFYPADGLPARRVWKGILLEAGQDSFTIAPASADEDGEITKENLPPVTIPFDRVRRAHRVHIFRRPVKPGKAAKPGKQPKSAKPKAQKAPKAPKKGKGAGGEKPSKS